VAVQDDTDEVEHEGKKYRIPKPLRGALLMQADYTRKTQELADQRRAHEDAQKAFGENQRAHSEHLNEFARVVALNDAIAQFEKADWPQIRANNPTLYDQLWFQYQQTKEQRDRAAVTLQQKIAERNSTAQRETAARLEQARSVIAREIPGWSPELAGKLNEFATAQGFTADELRQVSDPRVIKLLHAAYQGHQATQKAAAVTKVQRAEAVKPLPTVATNTGNKVSPVDAASDRLSTDEWLKRRNAQINKRKAR
jgi:hypothetical protein